MEDKIFIGYTIYIYMNHLGMWYDDIQLPSPTPKPSNLVLTSLVSFLKALSVAALSKGLFWFLPNIFGKYSGRSLPRQRLASVIVRGPPERITVLNINN